MPLKFQKIESIIDCMDMIILYTLKGKTNVWYFQLENQWFLHALHFQSVKSYKQWTKFFSLEIYP